MPHGIESLRLALVAQLALLGACGAKAVEGEETGSDSSGETGEDGSDDGTGGDDGATGSGGDDGGTTSGGVLSDAFRCTDMYIRDPHFLISLPIIGCTDLTDTGVIGNPSINEMFNESIDTDADDPPDGLLDLSFLLLFRPLDQAGDGGDLEFAVGDCTAPAETTSCDLAPGASPQPTTYENTQAGTCLEPDPAHLSSEGYDPAPVATTSPCFVAGPLDFVLELGDFTLPLQDAEIAAQYVGDPADSLIEGMIRGFMTEEDADAMALPDTVPVLGGSPISSLLPGGTDNCAEHDDRDDNGGTSGWWFYVEFTAAAVPYTGP